MQMKGCLKFPFEGKWRNKCGKNVWLDKNGCEHCALFVLYPKHTGGNRYGITVTHYDDVIMAAIASHITSLTIVYSIVYSDTDQRKHQSSASLTFVRWIHRDRWIPRTNGQLRGKCFHLMTSSCWRTISFLWYYSFWYLVHEKLFKIIILSLWVVFISKWTTR